MSWIHRLDGDERMVVLASLLHNLHHEDADLNADQWNTAERMFADLDAAMNGAEPSGYAVAIDEADRKMVWAMLCGYCHDIHAPVDNLSKEAWDRAEELFGSIDNLPRGPKA